MSGSQNYIVEGVIDHRHTVREQLIIVGCQQCLIEEGGALIGRGLIGIPGITGISGIDTGRIIPQIVIVVVKTGIFKNVMQGVKHTIILGKVNRIRFSIEIIVIDRVLIAGNLNYRAVMDHRIRIPVNVYTPPGIGNDVVFKDMLFQRGWREVGAGDGEAGFGHVINGIVVNMRVERVCKINAMQTIRENIVMHENITLTVDYPDRKISVLY